MASPITTAPAAASTAANKNYVYIISILGLLFFMLGFITWLNGTLIQFLKLVCQLKGDVQPFLVTFAFYMAYFVLATPSSYILKKTGYKKGMALGLFVMALGSLIFIPAANNRAFGLFLTALFTQGMGLTLIQTAINPYISIVGPIESAAKRMSIMGICNKIAGALSPIILGVILLNNASKLEAEIEAVISPAQKELLLNQLSQKIILPYIILAVISVAVAILIYFSSLPEIKNEEDKPAEGLTAKTSVFQFPHLVLGFVCLFLYVGVEVMAGDAIGAYGKSLGLPLDETKYFTSFTLFSMLAGYIIGILAIPKYLSQQAALKYSAILGILLSLLVFVTDGYTSIFCIALMGLANALMWPAIWPLALKNLGRFTQAGSALLIMGIAGGALIPLVYGYLKGAPFHLSNALSFLICMLPAYVYILYYAVKGNQAR
ncbi:MAG: sugar MFS transporter [Chitinophagaceae bacterium]